ncbi:uncharacterized protein LOC123412417 [Hordeum vulgare subsp. vulgare]|uniref:uncharacterized protein LOC123412417 n=1 Tax=Hordeum vulgare subsp. vulgare TaxID=112509 RepID=UPI001D1A330A|nr:uncharacterized protein LOC123412417 [Hordeum vulgare subsp. vulgare]
MEKSNEPLTTKKQNPTKYQPSPINTTPTQSTFFPIHGHPTPPRPPPFAAAWAPRATRHQGSSSHLSDTHAADYYQGHVQGEPYQDPPVMAPPHYAMPPLWVQPSFLEGWCSSHVFHFSTGQLSSDQMHHRPAVLFLDSWARP